MEGRRTALRSLNRGRIGLGLTILLAAGTLIAGFILRNHAPAWTGIRNRTAWDMTQLLFVPLSISLVAYYLNTTQRTREAARAEAVHRAEQENESNRERADALQL